MKVNEILESNDWDNAPFESNMVQIRFLERKRKDVEHQRKALIQSFLKLEAKGIIFNGTSKPPSSVLIKGTGTADTAYNYFYANPDQPEVLRFETHLNNLVNLDVSLQNQIKELTVKGHSFVFTGFRDTDLEAKIIRQGGRVVTSVSSKTDFVVAVDPNQHSGKLQKAKELGVGIISKAKMIQILR